MIAFPATTSPAADSPRAMAERHLSLVEQAARSAARQLGGEPGEYMATGWTELVRLFEGDALRGADNVKALIVARLKSRMRDQYRNVDSKTKRTAFERGVRCLSADAPMGDADGPTLAESFGDGRADAGNAAAAAESLLANLPPLLRRVVQAVDLDGADPADAAADIGIAPARLEELRRQAHGLLKKVVAMNQKHVGILGDERLAELCRRIVKEYPDAAKAKAEIRWTLEREGLLDLWLDRSLDDVVPQMVRQVWPDRSAASATPNGGPRPQRIAGLGMVAGAAAGALLETFKVYGKPLGQATLGEVRKAATEGRAEAVRLLEDAHFLGAIADATAAEPDDKTVAQVMTERQVADLRNGAARLVAAQVPARGKKSHKKKSAASPAG